MNRFSLILISSLALACLSACSAEQGELEKMFVYESFLGEGKPEYQADQSSLALRNTPDGNATIERSLVVSIKQNLPFARAITRNVQVGQVKVIKNMAITARNFGEVKTLSTEAYFRATPEWKKTMVSEQDEINLLMWLSEGNCLLSINKAVHESATCPTEQGHDWVMLNQPMVETWILLSTLKAEGWVEVDGQQVSEVSRSF